MELIRIRKPNPKRVRIAKVMEVLRTKRTSIQKLIDKTFSPKYLSWEKVRKWPASKGIRNEELWEAVRIRRSFSRTITPILSEEGEYFAWVKLPGLDEFFHEMDMTTGGSLFHIPTELGEKAKQRYISRGVMEEAIASSQLEGAHTSRKVAKQMLREGRRPRTEDEQMILNNYDAMLALEGDFKDRPMSLEDLFELHSMLTRKIIDSGEMGRFRTDAEEIVVTDADETTIFHKPPKEAFLNKEIQNLLLFANDEAGSGFIHPIVKAIMLHFWMGYLHPFTDGNGRMARMLFYWYLLRNDYWAFAYLPLSSVIKKSPVQYGDAYIYAEQDDHDLTYFIDFNIRKIKEATRNFVDFLDRKMRENKRIRSALTSKHKLNERQINLLLYYLGNPDGRTSWSVHRKSNSVSRQTAASDLKKLESIGYIKGKKEGRNVFYYATTKTKELSGKVLRKDLLKH